MRNLVIFMIILCCIIKCKDDRSCKSYYNDNDAQYCSLFREMVNSSTIVEVDMILSSRKETVDNFNR